MREEGPAPTDLLGVVLLGWVFIHIGKGLPLSLGKGSSLLIGKGLIHTTSTALTSKNRCPCFHSRYASHPLRTLSKKRHNHVNEQGRCGFKYALYNESKITFANN